MNVLILDRLEMRAIRQRMCPHKTALWQYVQCILHYREAMPGDGTGMPIWWDAGNFRISACKVRAQLTTATITCR